jgi:hypothetical protein
MKQDGNCELVLHLRAVHFALTVLSFILLVSSLLPTSNEVRTARTDIREIAEAVNRWDSDWLEEGAMASLQRAPKHASVLPTNVKVPGLRTETIGVSGQWGPPGPTGIPRTVEEWSYFGRYRWREFPPRLFLNLSRFRDFWNYLSEVREIYIPSMLFGEMYVLNVTRGARPEKWRNVEWQETTEKESSDLSFNFIKFTCDGPDLEEWRNNLGERDRNRFKCAFIGHLGPKSGSDYRAAEVYKVILPSQTLTTISFDAQLLLIEHLKNKNLFLNWRKGIFGYSFRELDRITRNYQDLTESQIELILAGESERTGESLEVGEIRFPRSALRTWGLLIIIAVQFYFFLHLRELARTMTPTGQARNACWIALYPNVLSTAVFVLSASVFPTSVASALMVESWVSGREPSVMRLVLFPIATAGSAVLAALSSRLLLRVKESRPFGSSS